ncbi:regulator of microtubule dynamics protein 1 isoform X6 [Phyllostomus discolor]|uniref:Regulator of microtubule dynamics protein 1 n=1 Tax=Phyllostomus discolor TaxID=89673 RepID=A0A7E6E6T3_9CHIR|nr:regulator of microtubule dynamics protein 1 isoform X6 [Phyllostomus discolor]
MVMSQFPRKVMALASRLWRFLPSGRVAVPGLRLPTRVTGGRGSCVQGLSGSEVAAEFWLTGRARAGYRRTQVIGNPGAFKRSLIFSALSYLGFETYQLLSSAAVVHATAKVFRVEEILQQADYLYESGETEKLYQLLTLYKESEDAELLWRLARASRDVAQLSRTSEEEKKALVYEALEYAKRALEKNEASFAAHKWYAICISDVGDYEGIKAKIANAYVIKEHFEALGYFQRAEQVDPNFYSKNLLLLGKTYLKLQNKKLAAFWLLKAKDYPAHTQEDKQVQAEATQLLTGFSGKN